MTILDTRRADKLGAAQFGPGTMHLFLTKGTSQRNSAHLGSPAGEQQEKAPANILGFSDLLPPTFAPQVICSGLSSL